MATYYGCTRTSYFQVKDVEKLKKILQRCSTEDKIDLFTKTIDGKTYYAFGCESSITGLLPDNTGLEDEGSYPELIAALQEIILPGEAVVILESGHEKLCYVIGEAVVITKEAYEGFNIRDMALEKARELLGNPAYKMQMEY